MVEGRYASIIERFVEWAVNEPAVRAAMIVGSQARSTMPADAWSDLDLVVFHTDPAELLASTQWFRGFGPVLFSVVEATAVGGSEERRVLFKGGRDVDFAVFPSAAAPLLTHAPEGERVLSRGYEILVDKDGELGRGTAHLRDRAPEPAILPTPQEAEACVGDFWYHVLWAAKKLRRGELWAAKMGCDGYLKRLLARMIGWTTVAQRGDEVDVWFDGRFIDRWADPGLLARLPASFGRYDHADLARALRETGRIFSDEAHELARRIDWRYPDEAESAVKALVSETLKDLP